jgi:phosphoenolpyruvate carboxylase
VRDLSEKEAKDNIRAGAAKRRTVRDLSKEAKENIRAGAAKRSEKAVEANTSAIRRIMDDIDAEVRDNEGLYPHPEKLTVSEVARRAGVTLTVLYKEPYKDLLTDLRKRLDAIHEQHELLKQGRPGKRPGPRRSLKERVQDWRELYERLKDRHMMTEVALLDAQDEIKKLRTAIDGLQESKPGELKVVPMPERD